jgi:hypothetical protein
VTVRDGDSWKNRMLTVNVAPAPTATASPGNQSNTPDAQLREKLVAAITKHTDALDKNDAAAVAANFTEDGVFVTPNGSFVGREAIEKHYAKTSNRFIQQ